MPTPEQLTIPDKLDSLNVTKQAIRESIVAKGVEVPEGTTFYEYANLIGEISVGTPAEYVNVTLQAISSSLKTMPWFLIKTEEGWTTVESGKTEYKANIEKGSVCLAFVKAGENITISTARPNSGECVVLSSNPSVSSYYGEVYEFIAFGDCSLYFGCSSGGGAGSN